MSSLLDIKVNSLDAFVDHRGVIFTTEKTTLGKRVYHHDKVCRRKQNVLVGIHGDYNTWKKVCCLYGTVYAVLVDFRFNSKDFCKYKTFILSGDNLTQLTLPPGIGNSFLVMSEECVYNYKLSYEGSYTDCDEQFTVPWNDSRLNIDWPTNSPILSARDQPKGRVCSKV